MQILIPIVGEICAELAVNAWYVLIFHLNSSPLRHIVLILIMLLLEEGTNTKTSALGTSRS